MKDRLYRFTSFDRAKIDRAARTVPLSFSSETPALQRAEGLSDEMLRAAGLKEGDTYVEVLDHEPENVDLSLLKNRGAFLDEHDDKDQIGVVESAEVADKHGRAIVKLDTHEKAEIRLGQMENNSRPHISAGYKYTKFLKDEIFPNGRKAKRFAWKALEISSVAVPADATIGVARAYQDLPEPTPAVDSLKTANAQHAIEELDNGLKTRKDFMPDAPVIDEKKIRDEAATAARTAALTDERTRSSEISTIADTLSKDHGDKKAKDGSKMSEKIRSIASEALKRGDTVDAFKIRCMEDVLQAEPAKPILIEDCTDEEGQKNYSLLRGIQSAYTRKEEGKSAIPDGLEGEVHQEFVRKAKARPGGMGFSPAGFQVPANAKVRMGRSGGARMQRDMQATVFNAGGAFVPTQLVVPIIELLRNASVLNRVGIRTMAGLTGNVIIPRQEAASTAYSVSEIAALTASQEILGQIALAPKRVGATQLYSKQFIMQSSPDAEAFIRDDMLKVIGLRWDLLGLNGQGAASEPMGIINTPGISSILFGATPTYIKLISMRTAIRKANVTGDLTLLSTPAVEGSLSGVAEALTGATTVGGAQNAIWKPTGMQGEGRVIGCPAIASNQVPNDLVLLGDFSQLIQGIWGGLDIVVDIFTKAANAEVVLTINTWGDYAVRHAQAFCVSADSGAQ